jgi:putative FmdB family regulatory protein
MPIYEYRCEACGEGFEVFVRSASQKASPTCPRCGSQEVKKAFSLFGVAATSGRTTASTSCSPGST